MKKIIFLVLLVAMIGCGRSDFVPPDGVESIVELSSSEELWSVNISGRKCLMVMELPTQKAKLMTCEPPKKKSLPFFG